LASCSGVINGKLPPHLSHLAENRWHIHRQRKHLLVVELRRLKRAIVSHEGAGDTPAPLWYLTPFCLSLSFRLRYRLFLNDGGKEGFCYGGRSEVGSDFGANENVG